MISNNEFDDWGQATDNDDPDAVASGVDLLQVAMRRKGLIALGMFVGICLGILYYAQADPTYESNAVLSIEENNPKMAVDTFGMLDNTTATEDHAIRITLPVIIKKALGLNAPNSGGKLADLPSLVGSENPVQDIFDGLTAAPIQDGSEILSLSYRGKNPEECGEILSTLIAAYSEHLTKDRGEIEQKVVEWIKNARDEIEQNLFEKNKQLNEWKLNVTEIVSTENGDVILPQEEQIRLTREVDLLEGTIAKLTNQIAFLQTMLDMDNREDYELNYKALLIGVVESDLNLAANEQDAHVRAIEIEKLRVEFNAEARSNERIVPLMMEDQLLAQRYGPDHPRRKALRDQIRTAEEFHEDADVSTPKSISERQSARTKVLDYLVALQNRLELSQTDLAGMKRKLGTKEAAAKGIRKQVVAKASLQAEIDRQERLFDSVVDKLESANMLQEYGDENKVRLTTLQYAGIGEKVAPSIATSLAAGSMLGFLAGFGLGYLVEMFDKTFRSPQEVSKVLQLPMIGHIPEINTEAIEGSALSEVLVAYHKPKSPLAENFRAIRTALYFSTGGIQHRVIQTTSPVPGDGKSTLIANLAITIAQSNKSVLLIDADFRRPTQHKLFGTTKEVGLASVVAGDVDPIHVVQETEVPNLSVMSCGPRPHNPSELLTSPQFEDLLSVLREQYEFVLIDTPPVLAVTDPGIVAARVDGVIMALRIRKNGRPSAIRARKILADLDASMLGIVVNGIDHRSGSYGYYSSYRRGYGYNYAYKYGYGQDTTEKAIGKYFEEPGEKKFEARS